MQGKNGGALKVGLGASAVFEGTTKFTDVSVMTVQLADDEEKEFKGAAIHNKVPGWFPHNVEVDNFLLIEILWFVVSFLLLISLNIMRF